MTAWEMKVLGYMAAAIEKRPEWIAVSSFRRVLREQGIFCPSVQDAIFTRGRETELWQLTGWSEVANYIEPQDWPEETILANGWRFARVALRYGPCGEWQGQWHFPSIRRMAEWKALGEAVSFV